MGDKIKMISNAEIVVFDNNGVKLQFDESLYTEQGNEVSIAQGGELVFSGKKSQVVSISYNSSDDVMYI